MKTIRITTLLACLVACCLQGLAQQATYVPTPQVQQAQQEFRDAKLGIFIHWGIYSMLGSGEWAMQNKNLNYKEYPHLADGFYPSKFDAQQWVRIIKASGARYVTFTSRHHDGFSMWNTDASPYNIADATPWGRDVVGELAQACHDQGIALHLYYSHLDWGRTDYPLGRTGLGTGRPTGEQDYAHYLEFMKAQLTELLTRYGKIGAIWFDGVWDQDQHPDFDWRLPEQYELIHSLQPGCMVANNHHQAVKPGEDIQIFEQDLPGENTAGYSGQQIGRVPLETCLTMNRSWGYDITDKQYKSADYLIQQLVKAAGKDANLLLNVGPRPDGQFPAEAIERLEALGKWMEQNGATIYGTRGGPVAPHDWGVSTCKGSKVWIHILNHQDAALWLPLAGVKGARMWQGGAKVGVRQAAGGTLLQLPAAPQGVDTIIELDMKQQ